MQDPFKIPLQKLEAAINAATPVLIDKIGVEALQFIRKNIRDGGFHGDTFQPYAPLVHPNKPRPHKPLMLDMHLLNSFTKQDSATDTTITSPLPYAAIQNEGGIIRHASRAVILSYAQAKNGKLRLTKRRTEAQRLRIRDVRLGTIGEHDQKIPARPFAKASPVLTRNCEAVIIKELIQRIKNS